MNKNLKETLIKEYGKKKKWIGTGSIGITPEKDFFKNIK